MMMKLHESQLIMFLTVAAGFVGAVCATSSLNSSHAHMSLGAVNQAIVSVAMHIVAFATGVVLRLMQSQTK